MLLQVFFLFCAFWPLALCNQCDWQSVEPVPYYDYTNKECPPPHSLINQGKDCSPLSNHNCQSFCQIKTTFTYDNEIPIGGTFCKDYGFCPISDYIRIGMYWEEPLLFPNKPFDVIADGVCYPPLLLCHDISANCVRYPVAFPVPLTVWAWLPIPMSSLRQANVVITPFCQSTRMFGK